MSRQIYQIITSEMKNESAFSNKYRDIYMNASRNWIERSKAVYEVMTNDDKIALKIVEQVIQPVKIVEQVIEPVKIVEQVIQPVKIVEQVIEPVKIVEQVIEPVKIVESMLSKIKYNGPYRCLNSDNDESCLLLEFITRQIPIDYIINVRTEIGIIRKGYYSFATIDDFQFFVLAVNRAYGKYPDFHEVVLPEVPQRMFFDIDGSCQDEFEYDMAVKNIETRMNHVLSKWVMNGTIVGIDQKSCRMQVLYCGGPQDSAVKISAHIVSPFMCSNGAQRVDWSSRLCREAGLKIIDNSYDLIDPMSCRVIPALPGVRSLRMPGSDKPGCDRKMMTEADGIKYTFDVRAPFELQKYIISCGSDIRVLMPTIIDSVSAPKFEDILRDDNDSVEPDNDMMVKINDWIRSSGHVRVSSRIPFIRLRSSLRCPICDRMHEKEDNLFIFVGNECALLNCRRNDNPAKRITIARKEAPRDMDDLFWDVNIRGDYGDAIKLQRDLTDPKNDKAFNDFAIGNIRAISKQGYAVRRDSLGASGRRTISFDIIENIRRDHCPGAFKLKNSDDKEQFIDFRSLIEKRCRPLNLFRNDIDFIPYGVRETASSLDNSLSSFCGWSHVNSDMTGEEALIRSKPFLDHIRNIICHVKSHGDSADVVSKRQDALFDYVMNWFAEIIQRPRNPRSTALVISGEQGSGKTFVLKLMEAVLGCAYREVCMSDFGNFRDALKNRLLCGIDETIDVRDNRGRQGLTDMAPIIANMKKFITNDTFDFSTKFKNSSISPNHSRLMICTNSCDPFRVDKSDRRMVFLEAAPLSANIMWQNVKEMHAYFDRLFAHLADYNNVRAFFKVLDDRDLTLYRVKDIPEIVLENKDERIMSSLGSVGRFMSAIIDGEVQLADLCSRITREDIIIQLYTSRKGTQFVKCCDFMSAFYEHFDRKSGSRQPRPSEHYVRSSLSEMSIERKRTDLNGVRNVYIYELSKETILAALDKATNGAYGRQAALIKVEYVE